MKSMIGFVIIAVSLVVGTVSASTAYAPRIDSLPTEGEPLTLSRPAGLTADNQPIAESNAKLDAALVEKLQASVVPEDGVRTTRVRVKEFNFGLWPERWWFILACVGFLVGGAVLKRRDDASTEEHEVGAATPETLAAVVAGVEALRESIDRDASLEQIGRDIEELQRGPLTVFIDGHRRIIDRQGLALFARVMDRFAAGERLLNRCWSAAADGYRDEVADCLTRSAEAFEEARGRLAG